MQGAPSIRSLSVWQDGARHLTARWWQLPRALRWTIWIAAACFVLFLRRPETLLAPQFSNEDGQVFFLGTFFGSPLEQIARPYAGFLYLVPRVVALLERGVPIAWAPFVSNLAALLLTALVAAFIAGDRLREAVPGRPMRWSLAALLLILPASHETLGSITYAQWYLGVYLVAASIATVPAGRIEAWSDRATLFAASLTGPLGAIFAPLFLARLDRQRDRHAAWAVACVSAPAVIEGMTFFSSPRPASLSSASLQQLLQIAGLRLVVEPLIGAIWSLEAIALGVPLWIGALATVVLAALLIVCARLLPRRVAGTLAYVWIVMAAAALVRGSEVGQGLLDPGVAERYFLIPGLVLGVVVVAGVAVARGRDRWLALSLGCVLAVGIVGDFRMPAPIPHDWSRESTCIGGASPCIVPINAPSWAWIHWPGAGGQYVQTERPPGT